MKKPQWDEDLSELAIKGRASMGNILTKNPIYRIRLKRKGNSTLGGRKIWFDFDVLRLNTEKRGTFIGEYTGDDKILVVTKDAKFHTSTYELSNHFEDNVKFLEKFDDSKVWTAILYDADQGYYYAKRFTLEDIKYLTSFIGDNSDSKLIHLLTDKTPMIEIVFGGDYIDRENQIIDVEEFIGVKRL